MSLAALVLLFVVTYLHASIFIVIGPGDVGVQWSRFLGGTKVGVVYGEGLNVILPWNRMYKYTVRLQQHGDTFNALSADGLQMDIDLAVRFQIVRENAGYLHKYVGPDYVETLLLPEVASHAREEIAQYEPQELYHTSRFQIQQNILEKLRNEIDSRFTFGGRTRTFVHVEDILIRGIVLPVGVREAISDKLEQEQLMLEYDYVLQKEEKEKERKRIEAEGIRAFQDIVNEGISDRYLRWKGIDATLRLAQSQNSKVVIIGAGDGGLPIILGNLDSPATLPPDSAPASPAASGAPSSGGVPGTTPGIGDISAPPFLPTRDQTPAASGAKQVEAAQKVEAEPQEPESASSSWRDAFRRLISKGKVEPKKGEKDAPREDGPRRRGERAPD